MLPLIRKLTSHVAEWKQETVIGLILVSVAAAFGLLHMVGAFGQPGHDKTRQDKQYERR